MPTIERRELEPGDPGPPVPPTAAVEVAYLPVDADDGPAVVTYYDADGDVVFTAHGVEPEPDEEPEDG